MTIAFEWDPRKATTNAASHGVSFEEAATVFSDPLEITTPDPDLSRVENRFISVGKSDRGRLLVVSYTERGDRIRVISAREAARRERNAYEED